MKRLFGKFKDGKLIDYILADSKKKAETLYQKNGLNPDNIRWIRPHEISLINTNNRQYLFSVTIQYINQINFNKDYQKYILFASNIQILIKTIRREVGPSLFKIIDIKKIHKRIYMNE